jgi:hypothetical protein
MSTLTSLLGTVAAGSEPAGGAATSEVVIATAMAAVVTSGLLVLCAGHRSGRIRLLTWAADHAARIGHLPRWAALPLGLGGGALHIALLGMYWDISLHVDQGRDAGPLANPAHYLILIGLFGIFAAGVIAIALPTGDERPGARAIRIADGWYAPVGGILMAACGAFALTGFPLDDMWHRMFGQDVTLWGPTHLMLIGGAGMSLVGMAVLLGSARDEGGRETVSWLRKVGLMGGLLVGLSTFQAEFDFGVPQFRMVLHPLLIAFAAAFALTAARLWIGRGGAIAAAVFFLLTRGWVTLLVGPVFGETTPTMALYVPEAILVEVAALAFLRRPLALGAAAGALAGTVGMAAEWGWTHATFRLPWTADILPEGVILAVVGGIAGGIFGALLGMGLRREFPRPRVTRPAAALALVALMACVADGLITDNSTNATVAVNGTDVRISPDIADGASWATATAWQGEAVLHVDRLERVGPGHYRLDAPAPTTGSWKAMIRVHHDRALLSAPIFLPEDTAIPAKEVPTTTEPRRFVADQEVLQREQKEGVASELKTIAPLFVLLIALSFAAALAWGVARIGRGGRDDDGASPPQRPTVAPRTGATPLPQ